jgi:hypothetical protein
MQIRIVLRSGAGAKRHPSATVVRHSSRLAVAPATGASIAMATILLATVIANRVLVLSQPVDTGSASSAIGRDADGEPVRAANYFRARRSEIETRLGRGVSRANQRRRSWLAYQARAGVVEVRYTDDQVADRVMVIADAADTVTDMMPPLPPFHP